MNRDELVRETFAHFGRAVYLSQVLEDWIIQAMIIARMPEPITRQDIDAFTDRQYKRTLGQLLKELAKYVDVPDDLSEGLGHALSVRNWLAHGFFRDRAEMFVTAAGCQHMINELDAASSLFEEASDVLNSLMQPTAERYGITEARVAEIVREMMTEVEDDSTPT